MVLVLRVLGSDGQTASWPCLHELCSAVRPLSCLSTSAPPDSFSVLIDTGQDTGLLNLSHNVFFDDVMVKQLHFAHSIPGHPRPLGRPHLTWMDTAMHDMGSLGRMLQIDLP